MPITIPAIGTISDPKKVRVALVQGQQLVSAPATALSDAVGIPSGGTTGQVLTKSSDTDYDSDWANVPASGDFSGPASSVDGNLVAFDGTTGKLGKDSGKKAADFATAAQGALADTAVQPVDLATVATSGSYDDLTGKPTLREVLTANRTYYVRTDGSNSNTGLANTAGGAFLTVQKALDTILANLDLGGNDVTVQVAAGTYTGAVLFSDPQVGAGSIILSGDTTTPSNVVLTVSSGFLIRVTGGGRALYLKGLKLVCSGSAQAHVYCEAGGYVKLLGKTEFGDCAGHDIQTYPGSMYDAGGQNEILSGTTAGWHYLANGGYIYVQAATWTASGTKTFGGFAQAAGAGYLYAFANSSSGTFTGSRYRAALNGVITSNGGGASYFPGSTAGTTATGGQYA